MSKAERQAMERLVVKLSALRKTLRGEERKLLDQMVTSAQAEVSLHNVKVAEKTVEGKAAGAMARHEVKYRSVTQGKQVDKSHAEVELHAAKADSATQGATMAKLMRSKAESVATAKLMRIAVDAKSQSYVIVD